MTGVTDSNFWPQRSAEVSYASEIALEHNSLDILCPGHRHLLHPCKMAGKVSPAWIKLECVRLVPSLSAKVGNLYFWRFQHLLDLVRVSLARRPR